ncbi:MAG: right-handed parallel beta-helix repeat-containing protein [Actinomycetia bacterium]|nr:right-handed parallel beta-helix repeat-containing protein [Actinomycetes bacterium]
MRINPRVWQIAVFGVVASATFVLSVGLTGTRPSQHVATPRISTGAVTGEAVAITVPPIGPSSEVSAGSGETTTSLDTDPDVLFVSSIIGNDDSDGQTVETPWASLQAAIDRLDPGQTLYVMDGQYSEQLEPGNAHYVIESDGAPEAWVRIAAAPGHSPELVPSSGNAMSIRANYVEVSGLRIRGENYGVDNPYGWGLLIRNSHHVRLASNIIADMPVGGISAVESANLEIYENEVFDNSFWGTEQGSGISVWHSRNYDTEPAEDGYHDKVIGNIIYGNENKVYSRWAPGQNIITDGNGIIIDEAKDFGYTGRTLVANNIAFNNGGRGIIVNRAIGVDIVFNTTFHNGQTEGLAGGRVEIAVVRSFDTQLLNNVAWSQPGLAAVKVIEAEKAVMGGNVFVTDTPSGQETDLDLVTKGDPGMVSPSVDPSVADFRLLVGSILIDQAIDVQPLLALDADGNPRPAVGPDVGAYEFVAS